MIYEPSMSRNQNFGVQFGFELDSACSKGNYELKNSVKCLNQKFF